MLQNCLFGLFCFASVLLFPQKQARLWYFGLNNSFDFSSGFPVAQSGGQTGSDVGTTSNQEGTSVICDSSGSLLFYTGGKTIWNRNHVPMPNGSGIVGGTSSTESSIIIPLPNNDSIFYVFTSDEFQSYMFNPPNRGYRYSVVNMCLDNGLGDVLPTQKNLLLADSSTEKLTACLDANGAGYWIVGHKMFSNTFIAWHLTAAGITDTVVTQIGTIHGWNASNSSWIAGAAMGEMKLSADGTKLALAIGNNNPAIIDLFDFNSSSGTIGNWCHMVIDSALQKQTYGVEFSPDGSKLYAGLVGGAGGKRIYQFNLLAGNGNCDSIRLSKFQLHQSYANSGVMFGMQLGPDGRIYIVCNTYYKLGRINFPNLSGNFALLDTAAVVVTGKTYNFPVVISGYAFLNGSTACDPNAIADLDKPRVTLWPNPTASEVVLEIGQSLQAALTIKVYDPIGRLIAVHTPSNSNQLVDFSSCESGVYHLVIHTQQGAIYKKVIVHR
jgi:hypothetical protein